MNNNPLIWLSSQVISQSAAVHETNLNTLELPTWVYYPVGFEQAADESLPVLIFLHGTGPQGQPIEAGLNDLLTRDGTTPTTEINNNNYPHNIVTFSPYKQTGDWDNATIAGFIQSILDNVKMFKIDSTRIFLAGLSLGSIGISQYIFLQSETSINYVTIKGVFLAAGGSSGVGAPQAQNAIDKNILIRGWLGSNEPNGFATVMTSNESQTNALQANYYELNIVPGGGHNNSTWGVPFGNHAAGSIYDNVETSTSTNIIPTNIIEEYATRRYRFTNALQQDGTTPAEIGDAVYEFVDIGRFARSNLVWDGTGTPPLRTATHVEIGVGNDIEYFNLLLASLAQPTSLWIVMENLAGNDFNIFCNSLGAIVQGNGSNIRLNAGTVATFSGGKPPDGQTSILQFNISGSSSEYFLNNVASGSNPLNAGTDKTTLIRIGNSSTSANWRFKEMFFTPLVSNEIANQIYSDLESTYLTQIFTPSPLFSSTKSDTSNYIWWNGSTNSLGYELERDTNSGFTNPIVLQNNNSREYLDTGLTANTLYHYRIKGIGFGLDSEYNTIEQKTISFTPSFWYEPTGIGFNTNNEYIDTSTSGGFLSDVIKSIFPIGLNATPTLGARSIENTNLITPVPKQINIGTYEFTSVLSLTGDFHILISGIVNDLVPINRILQRSISNAEIRFNSSDNQIVDSISLIDFGPGPNVSITPSLQNQLEELKYYNIEFKRVSGNILFRVNGNSWDTGSTTNTDTLNFDSLGDLFSPIERFVVVPRELTDNEANEVFNYLDQPDYNVSTPISTININTPNSINNNIVEINNLDNKGTASFIRDRALMINNNIGVILLNKDESQNWEDFIIFHNLSGNSVSNQIDLGVPEPFAGRTMQDYHNSGSITKFDNQMIHFEAASHYDGGLASSQELVLKRSGNNFDVNNFYRTSLANNIPNLIINNSQYHQSITHNNIFYLFHQEDRYRSVLHRFNDGIVYPERILIFDGGSDDTQWMYKNLVYSEDGILRLFLLNYNLTNQQDRYVFYIKSTDSGNTWQNASGTFSKELFISQTPLTLTELINNCLVFDTNASGGNIVCSSTWFDGTNIHGVTLGEDISSPNPGTNQFNTYFRINDTTGAIQKFEIDTGSRIVFSNSGSDGYPILWLDNSNNIHVACFEINNGNWIWVEFESTDNGLTWNFVQNLSNDNTFKFKRPFIIRNGAYITGNQISIGCIREDKIDTSLDNFNGNGDLLIKSINIDTQQQEQQSNSMILMM